MSRAVYTGISNVAKNVKSLYVGVGGSSRKVIRGYVGINNTARLFWRPIAYKMQQSGSSSTFYYIQNTLNCKLPTKMEFDTETGKFILSGSSTLKIDDGGSSLTFYTTDYTTKKYTGAGYYLTGVDAITAGTYDGPIYEIRTHLYVSSSQNSASSIRCYIAVADDS